MMSDRRHFLNLARISRRVAKNITDKSIADRLEQMAIDYEHEAISDALADRVVIALAFSPNH
jgi:hypothetical protein